MTEQIWVQLITTAGLIMVAWLGNRKLNRIGADAKLSAEQTVNSHQEAEFPNLRVELTAVHADVRAMSKKVTSMSSSVQEISGVVQGHDRHFKRIERNLKDLHDADEHFDETLDRDRVAATRALTSAVATRNQKLEELRDEISQHIESCPWRPGT